MEEDGMRKRLFILAILVLMIPAACFAESTEEQETEEKSGFWDGIGDWFSGAANDVGEWTSGAVNDAGEWVSDAASDVGEWTSGAVNDAGEWIAGAATDAWHWTSDAASTAWDGVTGFFNPPETTGNPNIVAEPELPEGTQKMYLGYEVQRTGLDNGYSESKSIDRDDPHFGLSLPPIKSTLNYNVYVRFCQLLFLRFKHFSVPINTYVFRLIGQNIPLY